LRKAFTSLLPDSIWGQWQEESRQLMMKTDAVDDLLGLQAQKWKLRHNALRTASCQKSGGV